MSIWLILVHARIRVPLDANYIPLSFLVKLVSVCIQCFVEVRSFDFDGFAPSGSFAQSRDDLLRADPLVFPL